MHLALGLGKSCVTIFNCTSPWEIHDYGLQTQLVSPLLERFFYQRGMDTRATTAIPVRQVLDAVKRRLDMPALAEMSQPAHAAGCTAGDHPHMTDRDGGHAAHRLANGRRRPVLCAGYYDGAG